MDLDAALLQVIASPTRRGVLALLARGLDHPEDLARRLDLRRQSVDKQLQELYGWGIVDRSAIFPADGRPRIVYRISSRGEELVEEVDRLLLRYREGNVEDYRQRLGLLEEKRTNGDLDEEAYRKQRRSLEARYDKFLREEG